MANSTLHLIVNKGPKQGETLACTAGTQIRIGRVVKGNTFPIKDPGISQKHLTVKFVPDIGRWTVEDLDTSNGTFINDAKIPSSAPFPLSDGDSIKIGETTLISVKIEGGGVGDGGLRRGRRAVRSTTERLDSVAVDEDNVEVRVEEPKNKGRGRSRKANSSRDLKKDEILDAVVENDVEVRPRRAGLRTRAASARISEEQGASGINVDADSVGFPKKNDILDAVVEDSVEAPKNVKRGRAKRAPPRTRARALSAKVIQADELCQSELLAEEVGEKVELNIESNAADENAKVLQADELCKSASLPKEVSKKGELNIESNAADGSAKVLQADELCKSASLAEDVSEKGELNVESNAADGSEGGGSGEEEKGKTVEEETTVDFEKMGVGEWLDSMEKCLPLAINEVAEQMIASLRVKARLLDEYIVNSSNDG